MVGRSYKPDESSVELSQCYTDVSGDRWEMYKTKTVREKDQRKVLAEYISMSVKTSQDKFDAN